MPMLARASAGAVHSNRMRISLATGVAVCAAVTFLPMTGSGRQHPRDPGPSRSLETLAIQVLLDRLQFSPGEIDGAEGLNTVNAIDAFEHERGRRVTDLQSASTVPTTVRYTITPADMATPILKVVPPDMMAKSKLPRLDYTSHLEMLGERFHSSPELLKWLNPGLKIAAGAQLVVPNVRVTRADRPPRDIVVRVSEHEAALTVTDHTGSVIMYAPATTGSSDDPLPIGSWSVTAVSRNPPFNYNPRLFWDADPSHRSVLIPPGPNGPVGVVWIDLSKPHYGIHGTPEPGSVGYTVSHGCVRLTNWDALRLAAMVRPGTKVQFVP
jgi:lipoprotein-anchoring transpeptidase ErfK/SrfK